MRPTSLSLDLLSCPPSSLLCPLRKLFVGSCLATHRSKPFSAEVVAKFAIRESFGDVTEQYQHLRQRRVSAQNVPNNTHGCTEQSFSAIGILVYSLEEREDRFDVRSEEVSCTENVISSALPFRQLEYSLLFPALRAMTMPPQASMMPSLRLTM